MFEKGLIRGLESLGRTKHDLRDGAAGQGHAAEFGQDLGGLDVRQAEALVEQYDGGLCRGADLTGGGAGGVGRLQGMPAAHVTATAAAAAAMNGKTPADGFLGNLGLKLGIEAGYFESAAAVGAAVRQRGVVTFVDVVFGGGRRPMAMGTMLGSSLAAWLLGMFLGWAFGKRRRLPLARTLNVFEQPLEMLDLPRLRLDLSFQIADALPQNQTLRA